MSVKVGQLFERRSNGATLRLEGFAEKRSKARMLNLETGRETRVRVDRLKGRDYRPAPPGRVWPFDEDDALATGEQFLKGGVVPEPIRSLEPVEINRGVVELLGDPPSVPVGLLHEPPSKSKPNWLAIIVAVVVLMIPLSLGLSALLGSV